MLNRLREGDHDGFGALLVECFGPLDDFFECDGIDGLAARLAKASGARPATIMKQRRLKTADSCLNRSIPLKALGVTFIL